MTTEIVLLIVIIALSVALLSASFIVRKNHPRLGITGVVLVVLIILFLLLSCSGKESSEQLNTSSTTTITDSATSAPKASTTVTSASEAREVVAGPDAGVSQMRAAAVLPAAAGSTEERPKPPILSPRSVELDPRNRGAVRAGSRFLGIPVACKPQDDCIAPKEFIYSNAPHPFNVRVTYGGEKLIQTGVPDMRIAPLVYWKWIKTENPSVPCSAAQLNEGASYEYGCKAKVGEVLFLTPKFYLEDPRELRLSSLRAAAQEESRMKGDAFEFPITEAHGRFRMNLLISTLGCQFTAEIWRRREGFLTEITGLNFPCDIPSSIQYSIGHEFQQGDTLVIPYRPNIFVYEEDKVIQIPRISLIDNISSDSTPIYGARVKW